MTPPGPDQQSDLLHFARDVYARDGIQPLCLRLQEELDVDVVMLLMCCWHGCYRGVLTETELAQAMAFSGQWRAQLVQPLRQARRWLKSHPADTLNIPHSISGEDQETLRQRIKALELDAEFMQLRALAGLFAAPSTYAAGVNCDTAPTAAIRANVTLYVRHALGRNAQSGLDEQTLAALIKACTHCL